MRKRHAEGVRVVTTLRLLPTIKEAAELAAVERGRSLAQEVEARLSWSFSEERHTPSPRVAMLLKVLGAVFQNIEEETGQEIGKHSVPTIAAREIISGLIPVMFPYVGPALDSKYEAGILAAKLAARREIAEHEELDLVARAEITSRHIKETLEAAGLLPAAKEG